MKGFAGNPGTDPNEARRVLLPPRGIPLLYFGFAHLSLALALPIVHVTRTACRRSAQRDASHDDRHCGVTNACYLPVAGLVNASAIFWPVGPTPSAGEMFDAAATTTP